MRLKKFLSVTEMDGDTIIGAFDDSFQRWNQSVEADAVASYEDVAPRRAAGDVAVDPELEAEALEKLRAPGYID